MQRWIEFWSRGEERYRFLSNFHMCPVVVYGEVWPSAEHAYQAMKDPSPFYQARVRLGWEASQAS